MIPSRDNCRGHGDENKKVPWHGFCYHMLVRVAQAVGQESLAFSSNVSATV
jgi:hypothetical protein